VIARLTKTVIIISACSFLFPVQANTLKSQLQHCSTLSNNNERLACYDQLSEKKSTLATTEVVKAPIAVTAAENKVDDFGKKHLKKEVAEQDQSIVFTIEKLKKLNYDNWQITFKNGQVWRQKDSKKIKLNAGDKVKLSTGFMSAIYLQKTDSNRRITVKRIK
jgi:hypothetical protein